MAHVGGNRVSSNKCLMGHVSPSMSAVQLKFPPHTPSSGKEACVRSLFLPSLCVQCRPKDSCRWHKMGSKSRGAWLHNQIRVDDQHCVDIRKCRVG